MSGFTTASFSCHVDDVKAWSWNGEKGSISGCIHPSSCRSLMLYSTAFSSQFQRLARQDNPNASSNAEFLRQSHAQCFSFEGCPSPYHGAHSTRHSCDHAIWTIIVDFIFHLLHGFFDVVGSLPQPLAQSYQDPRSNKGVSHTFGSRFSAVVKCLIAFPFCLRILYTRPSKKCTFASSGAISLSTFSS